MLSNPGKTIKQIVKKYVYLEEKIEKAWLNDTINTDIKIKRVYDKINPNIHENINKVFLGPICRK